MRPNNHTVKPDNITMNNNDILRRTRYILDLKDNQITKIFKHVKVVATEQQVNLWLKREDEAEFVPLPDETLIDFLDALIIEKRGEKEDGPTVRVKQKLDNNLILMKLKIAFHLKAEDALAIMELAEFKISKHEFSALFRKKDHKHYRVCKNQMLRKFMKGLQLKYRGQTNAPKKTNSPQNTSSPQKTIIKDVEAPSRTGKMSLAKKAPSNYAKPQEKPSRTNPQKASETETTDTKSNVAKTTVETKTVETDSSKKPISAAASVWKIPKKPIK